MVPTYAYQDSFPLRNGHVQYFPYFQPTSEAVPSQMMVDPSKVPIFYGTGPYGANYSYPAGCHSCCNHMPFAGHYAYSAPCPHPVPPQPSPWWGSYPLHPQSVLVHHVPAPPVYAQEIPRYEYDKDVAARGDNHCCGCPNHVCDRKNERSVEVEEKVPSLGKEMPSSEGGVQSLAPSDPGNYQYPIIWIPPDFVKNNQQKKPFELKFVDTEDGSPDVKPRERSSQQRPWKSFFPVDKDSSGHGMSAADGQTNGNQQPEDNTKQFPYPIIWMPYSKHEGAEREQKHASPIHSATSYSADDRIGEPRMDGNMARQHAAEDIPVTEGESLAANIHKENAGKCSTDISDKGSRRKGPVSPKEKLPPVCLRVDPLPRRKNSNGSSRSPSPPSARGNASSVSTENKRRNQTVEAAKEKKAPEEKRKEVKVIEVKDCSTNEMDGETLSTEEGRSGREVASKGTEEDETVKASQDNIAGDDKMEGRKERVDRTLSDTEAATLIQAAYRGFEMRKWETKKKLKQMARIREEMGKIKKSIQEVESSQGGSFDLENVTKRRMLIGESIMSLLLTLDTIQGLHPSLRDVRKSLARELVTLQEKLDFLASKRLEELVGGQSPTSPEEYVHEVSAGSTSKKPEISRKEDLQSLEAESTEVELPNAEELWCSPSEVESSGEMVNADHGCQQLVSNETECEDIESSQSVEQVCEMKELSEGYECQDMEEDKHEDGLVSHDEDFETELMAEVPSGVLTDEDQEMLEPQEKVGVPSEHCEPQKPLEEESGGSITGSDAGLNPLERPETEKNKEVDGSSVNEEEQCPQNEADDDGEVVPVTPGQIKDESTFSESVDGKEGQPQKEDNDGGVCALSMDDAMAPEQAKDEIGSFTLPNEEGPFHKGDVSDEQVAEQSLNQEREIEENHEQSDWRGPEKVSVEQMIEHPGVPEGAEEEDVVIIEDESASEVVVVPSNESKSGYNKPDDGLESSEKLLEENEKLRAMMQKLMEAGKEQLEVISSLTGRVKDLEKKLAKNKKLRSRRCKAAAARASRLKPPASAQNPNDHVLM